jgi:Ca2+-binding EF-hand superfamily protein
MKPLIATLTLALILPAAAAMAQDAAPRDPMRGFKLSDTNGDGQLSYDEYHAMSMKMIDRAVARRPDSRMASATPEQREALIKQRFAAIDANKDGVIDATEWANRPHGRGARPATPPDHS